MSKNNLSIQDKGIIARTYNSRFLAESAEAPTIQRLEEGISQLMDEAQKMYQDNCYKPGTAEIDDGYIARLSTNEFFFYTKEPLTLKEFEELQNKIAEKAKKLSPGVQLILASFGVFPK